MTDDNIRLAHPFVEGLEVAAADLWHFPDGLMGLADLRRFALVPLENAEPFELLASAEGSTFGIVLVEPTLLVPDYALELDARELHPIREADPSRLEIRVPVRLPAGEMPMSLNLRGPIVLAPAERLGVQRISPDEGHSLRFTPRLAGTGPPACSS